MSGLPPSKLLDAANLRRSFLWHFCQPKRLDDGKPSWLRRFGHEIDRPDRGFGATKRLPRVTIDFKYVNMTDVNSGRPSTPRMAAPAAPGASPADVAEDASPEAVQLVELLFFAYRDFTGDADAILAEFGYGRAHHRVLHFITRYPGLRVADLLLILNITKQSLARVLRQLVEGGLVVQAAGDTDRRERRLHVTAAGKALMRRLVSAQTRRIRRATGLSGPGADAAIRRFLTAMIEPETREMVSSLLDLPKLSKGLNGEFQP
jgi:DNA-binding MarR family transcriptional regulator